ncbi:hypothetical protein WDW89_10810, partial [Deltaproteobacteria bacterium TL4]
KSFPLKLPPTLRPKPSEGSVLVARLSTVFSLCGALASLKRHPFYKPAKIQRLFRKDVYLNEHLYFRKQINP